MKTMSMNRMQMCCCCCGSMRMMNDKEERNRHIINIYKERQEHEKISIYDSIRLRVAS